MLDERPYLDAEFNLDVHRRIVLGFGGYLVYDECLAAGDHLDEGSRLTPTPECIARHQMLCEQNYLPELLPEQPGCLLTGRWTTVGFPVTSVVDLSRRDFSRTELAEQGFTTDEVPAVQALVLEMTARGIAISNEEVRKLAGAPLLETLKTLDSDGLTNLLKTVGYLRDKDALSVILDPARTFVERRDITLPLAGEVALSVIWPYQAPSRAAGSPAMKVLESAIRHHEGIMGVRFPLDYYVLILADPTPWGGFSTRGVMVAYHTDNRDVIAHEAGHTYAIIGPGWIIEGVATFLDVVSRRPLNGAPIRHPDLPCHLFDTLAELDRSDLGSAAIHESRCTYHLGLAIFQELYNRLGFEAFREGLASLYLNGQDSNVPACTGINGEPAPDTDSGFCQMMAAFVDGMPSEKAAIAEAIIYRRYYGVSP